MSAGAGGLAPVRLRTVSEHDTRALGAALARALRPGDVVLLTGDWARARPPWPRGSAPGSG